MTGELPAPGSVWKRKADNSQIRAVLVDEKEIVAHNCELCMVAPGMMISWAGTPEEFFRRFVPGDPEAYPKTANT